MSTSKIITYKLHALSHSKFRSSFHLNDQMKAYAKDKGVQVIRMHAYDFINERLRPANPLHDGKQTPMRQVHPVFIAQHATATCCRKCLYKWHQIEMSRELTDREVDYIVALILHWIAREVKE
ncbi:MAG: DUF4186 domain-containing protein [bacterium]